MDMKELSEQVVPEADPGRDAYWAGILDKGGRFALYRGEPGFVFWNARPTLGYAFVEDWGVGQNTAVRKPDKDYHRFSCSGPAAVVILRRLRPYMRDPFRIEELDRMLERCDEEVS